MSDYEAKRIIIIIGVIALVWFLFTKANINLHTGGDETRNGASVTAWTLVGSPKVEINQGSGKSFEAQVKNTIKCPFCDSDIPFDSIFCPYCGQRLDLAGAK